MLMKVNFTKAVFFSVLVLVVIVIGKLFAHQESEANSADYYDPIKAVYAALPDKAKSLYYEQSEGLTKPVPQRLVELDQLTIGCFVPSAVMQMPAIDKNLGGQCCGVLKDIEAYELQLKALHAFIEGFGNRELIPRDPYDVPVKQAQELISYDTGIALSLNQQKIYDQAIAMSHHGGPCCCKCWKWYMMSGLGKKLLVEDEMDVQKLAKLWDLSSSCGHDEDTNMHEHYQVKASGHKPGGHVY